MVMDPVDNATLYTSGLWNSGANYRVEVSKSTNDGAAWIRYALFTGYGYTDALAINPSNRNIVFVGTSNGVYRTTDAGTSWALSSTGLSSTVYEFAIHPTSTNIMYAAAAAGLYVSTDTGVNWTRTGAFNNVKAVIIDPSNPLTVYAGSTIGIYKSTDGFRDWTKMSTTGLRDSMITSLAKNSTYLFAGTNGEGLYRYNILIGSEETRLGQTISLLSVKPTAFRKKTTVSYQLSSSGISDLSIHDIQGRRVRQLVNRGQNAGAYSFTWDGTDENGNQLNAGVYFCALTIRGHKETTKLIFLR